MAVRKILKEVIEHLQTQGAVRVDQAPYWIAQLEHAEELQGAVTADFEARLANIEQRLYIGPQSDGEIDERQKDDIPL